MAQNQLSDKDLMDLIKQSPELRAELTKHAKRLTAQANKSLRQRQSYPDYAMAVEEHDDGPRAAVFTRSNHAKYSNAKHHTLLRVLGGAQ